MAKDRTQDIIKVMKEIKKLKEALGHITRIKKYNTDIGTNLDSLGRYYTYSAKIPQEDFAQKISEMNSNIGPSADSMQTKIEEAIAELEEMLQKLIEQQEDSKSQSVENNATVQGGGGGVSYQAVM